MADGFDRFDQEMRQEGGGGSFVMGLLTGTVLGAGLGMLFAPKAGVELRSKLTDQAGTLANTASEGYRRASESAGQWAEKGKEIYSKASEAVAKGAEEAQQYVRDSSTTFGGSGSGSSSSGSSGTGSGYGSGSTYAGSTESIRGAAERTPGSSTDSSNRGPGSTPRRS